MSFRRLRALIALQLALICVSCRSSGPKGPLRLAIVPFEDLGNSSSLNWAGRGIASALAYDLAPAPEVQTAFLDSISSVLASPATEMVQGYYSASEGRIRLVATLTDLEHASTRSTFAVEGNESAGLLPLLNQLARQISQSAREFGTRSPDAFRAYAEALNGKDPQAILASLDSAEKSDPHFSAVVLFRAKILLAEGKRDEALQALAAGRAASTNTIDSAEFDYLATGIRGDRAGRIKALESLTTLTPADPRWMRELADLQLSERRFTAAAQAFERLTQIDPDDPSIWNQLGYAYSYALDLANAKRALEHYNELLGGQNWNAFDSLGEVSFYFGDFAAAEKYFLQSRQNNAARAEEELLKAAQARLMTGDLPGADGILASSLQLAKPAQRKAAEFEKIQWDFLTGRRKSSIAQLDRLIPSFDPEQQSLALSQLAIWKLETGSNDQLDQIVAKSESLARGPRAKNLSELCRYILTRPQASSGSKAADAYAFLFARKFADALPLLTELYRGTSPSQDGQIRALTAWAYVETNHLKEARDLVATYPMPLASGDPVFASLVFPRFLQVRATVLEKDGNAAAAKQNQDLFVKYAGDLPDVLGGKPNS